MSVEAAVQRILTWIPHRAGMTTLQKSLQSLPDTAGDRSLADGH